MKKFICVHGHFYQPPRENPWLEAIELQDSAYPYHDWNERITAECYAPNTAARILDASGTIENIVNNYSKISFNFGPTLLSWMKDNANDIYRAVLDADKESARRFSGHGSALAQAYNHMIMPLANARDKETQVIWGVRDFTARFGRAPEGMWLPETAVDLETLGLLADHGVEFTILAPRQAARVRAKGTRNWRDVGGGEVDPSMPYEIALPNNKTIVAFFYDGPMSQGVAFEGLLKNGERFARRLSDGFDDKRTWNQLVHIATDGETYGHHHRYGEMALSYALNLIEKNEVAGLTNYGEFLERNPPTHEAQIFENSSWSCVHGVERWRGDCGCNSGRGGGWRQTWRQPLREALDWLRDDLAPKFEARSRDFLKDPWAARNDYISVILDRRPENVDDFFRRHAPRELRTEEKTVALKLLELQRQLLLMYTSCGWFFDEISGIETVQVMQYAGRAIQLSGELFDNHVEDAFMERLSKAPSNIPENRDGKLIYEKFVLPAKVNLAKVGAHYAISSLFQEYEEGSAIYSFDVDRDDYQTMMAGRAKAAVGRLRVTSRITRESSILTFGVLHLGDHNLTGGVRDYRDDASYAAMTAELSDAFSKADFPDIIRAMDRHFGISTYSLKTLFRDEQRKITNSILGTSLEGAESMYRQIYENNATLIHFLSDLSVPMPRALHTAAEFMVNKYILEAVRSEPVDRDRINGLLVTAKKEKIHLDVAGIGFTLQQVLERAMTAFGEKVSDIDRLRVAKRTCDLLGTLPFDVNLWRVQNEYFILLKGFLPDKQKKAAGGDAEAATWVDLFMKLGMRLRMRIEPNAVQPPPSSPAASR